MVLDSYSHTQIAHNAKYVLTLADYQLITSEWYKSAKIRKLPLFDAVAAFPSQQQTMKFLHFTKRGLSDPKCNSGSLDTFVLVEIKYSRMVLGFLLLDGHNTT